MLITCCCLVVESGSWCWFGAAGWWWNLEAEADLLLMVVALIFGAVQGPLECADSLILLILLLLPSGGSWKLMLIVLLLPGGSWKLMLIFWLPSWIWLETVVQHHEKLAGNSVKLAWRRSQYGHQCSNVRKLQDEILEFTNFNANLWIFKMKIKVNMYFPYISQVTGLFLSDFSKFVSDGCQFWLDPLMGVK